MRARLRAARDQVWKLIERTAALRTSELWSWSYSAGQYRIEPFGRPGADVDESNAAQLWSTVESQALSTALAENYVGLPFVE